MSLKEIPLIAVLSPLVTRILGLNPGKYTLQGTNTYLIGSGKKRILLDTGDGRAGYTELLKRYLDITGIEISTVLVSHWHPDHIGGILGPHNILNELNYSPDVYKGEHEGNDIVQNKLNLLHDGQTFPVGSEATLTAYFTPGHAADHFVFWLDKENALFSADNVLGEGTTVFSDLHVYVSSLRRMNQIGLTNSSIKPTAFRIYPGHGPIVEDGSAKIIEYIDHRQQREDEVVEYLSSHKGPSEVHAIVRKIYTDLPQEKFDAALRGIQLHLNKLAVDAKAVEDEEGRWSLVNRRSPPHRL